VLLELILLSAHMLLIRQLHLLLHAMKEVMLLKVYSRGAASVPQFAVCH